MTTRMISVKDLIPGMIIGENVLSANGKVLLGQDVIVSPRTISLLSMWDVNSVYIWDTVQTTDVNSTKTVLSNNNPPNLAGSLTNFYKEYKNIVSTASQSFDFVRNHKQVPIQDLKDTSFNIYSTILTTGSAMTDFLLISDYNLADQISRHSVMVSFISGMIGRQMKCSEAEVKTLVLIGLLHDIGKFVITKEQASNPAEHVIRGGRLLRNVEGISLEIMAAVLCHHEFMDGSGFPMAKGGNKIPLFARIVAVADLFHNHSYDREYSNPFPALEQISQNKYTKLDPEVCQLFISKVKDSLMNSTVMLNDGRAATVIFIPGENYANPIVKTEAGTIIDLATTKKLFIQYIINPENQINLQ